MWAASGASRREAEEAADGQLGARSSPQVCVADPGESGDARRKRGTGVDERLEGVLDRERAHAYRSDLAHAVANRREPGRLEVEDDELGVLDQDVGVRWVRQPDACAEPGEPSVTLDDVVEQRAGERGGRAFEREEHVRSVLGRHRPAPSLDELDQSIRSVERELHEATLANICSYLKQLAASMRSVAQNERGAASRRPLRNPRVMPAPSRS